MQPEDDLIAKDLFLFPIEVTGCRCIANWFGWDGFTAGPVILYADAKPSRVIVRHEHVHYRQFRELLFLPFAVLYVLWTVVGTLLAWWHLRGSLSEAMHHEYFETNPFELEARYGERKRGYLGQRSWCAWTRFVRRKKGR
jgi:hypothetical protein